ncbi:hypothetical protein FRC11_006024 [Ceratobasidium sp. 423]|nr:hypothetical protein FRC11_006024 [Ceratobasidium sp. 423]
MDAIRALIDLGKERDEEGIKSMARGITLQHLRDALDMSWYKGFMISLLAEPEVVRACVKLMATVIPEGHETASPFSYEYGYLCFRIAAISFSLCFTESLLDSAVKDALTDLRRGNVHILEVVSGLVADCVKHEVQLSPTLQNKKVSYGGVMILQSRDALCLLDMLWADRNLFLRVILQTYTPGITALMHRFWQLWRNDRLTSSDGDLRLGVPLYELLRRYHLGVTRDQDTALSALLSDTLFLGDLWLSHSQLLDAKDSKTLIYGYTHRLTTPETWRYRPKIRSLPPILEFITRFAQQGAEHVFASLFSITISFLWGQIECKNQIKGDDIINIIQIFHHFMKLIEIIPDTSHDAMRTLVRELVNSDLVGLVSRLIVLRRSIMENSDDERVQNQQLFTKFQSFFERLTTKIPQQLLLVNFTDNLDDWMRHRDYMRWCSEILGSSEQNRRYCDAGWEVWRERLESVDQHAKVYGKTDWPVECSYVRCSHSGLMTDAKRWTGYMRMGK